MSKGYFGAAGDGLMNLNGHVMCCIDTETSGLVAGYNDLVEIAVIPLGADMFPSKKVLPFVTKLFPKDRYPDSWTEAAERVNGISRTKLINEGQDPWKAADRFEEWVGRLGLGPNKKIAPLAFNWPFDKPFVLDWLQPQTFEALIWHRYRDVMPNVLMLNDKAEFDGRDCPFPQTALQDIRARMKIPPNGAHTALGDALVTIECYRELMTGDWFRGTK